MPAEGASVVVNVSNTGQYTGKWGAFGQVVFVSKLLGGSGYFAVVGTTSTTMTLVNIKNTGTGAYATNPAPGTVFTSGANVSPSGLQGLTGASGSDLIYISYNDNTNLNTVGYTAVATVPLGTALYLQAVGDSIELEFDWQNLDGGTTHIEAHLKVEMQGVNIIPNLSTIPNGTGILSAVDGYSSQNIKMLITRISNTSVSVRMEILQGTNSLFDANLLIDTWPGSPPAIAYSGRTAKDIISGINLTLANSIIFYSKASTGLGNGVSVGYIKCKKLDKI